jgi:hypothetical protein
MAQTLWKHSDNVRRNHDAVADEAQPGRCAVCFADNAVVEVEPVYVIAEEPPLVTAILGPVDQREARAAANKALYDSRIEWHKDSCQGRHGVVRGVTRAEFGKIAEMLVYYFGSKCYWNKKGAVKGTYDVEFATMTKVYPAPKKPWDWCGTSVLFEDWHQQETAIYAAARQYKAGDQVSFDFKGETLTGLVSNIAKRVTVIVPGRGKIYVPGSMLRRA